MTVADVDPRTVPGAMEVEVSRELSSGGLIEFCMAPKGWLTKAGEPRKRDYRAYHWTPPDGKRVRVPSVTTLLDAVLPLDLSRWGEEHGIRGAVEALRRGLITSESTDEFAVDQVRAYKLGADAARERATDRGINAHSLVEHYMRTGEPPNPKEHLPEHYGFIRALTRWLLYVEPEPVAIEQLVVHPSDMYAGRIDLRCRIDGRLETVDFKTSPKAAIWDKAHAQARLYERAAVACGDEPAEGCRIVVFAADGAFREMECLADDETVEAALTWYRALRPISDACQVHNRVERDVRKARA